MGALHRNPGAMAVATGAPETVQAGELNYPQDTPSPRRLQLLFLQSRYGFGCQRAMLLADLIFERGGAA